MLPKKNAPKQEDSESDFSTTVPFDASTMPMGLEAFLSDHIDLSADHEDEKQDKRKAPSAGASPAHPARKPE